MTVTENNVLVSYCQAPPWGFCRTHFIHKKHHFTGTGALVCLGNHVRSRNQPFLYLLVNFLYACLISHAWWAARVEEHQRECSQDQWAFPPITARHAARNTTRPTPGTATVKKGTTARASAQGSDQPPGALERWVSWLSWTKALAVPRPGLKQTMPTYLGYNPTFISLQRQT